LFQTSSLCAAKENLTLKSHIENDRYHTPRRARKPQSASVSGAAADSADGRTAMQKSGRSFCDGTSIDRRLHADMTARQLAGLQACWPTGLPASWQLCKQAGLPAGWMAGKPS
jgi:hypothetical protein